MTEAQILTPLRSGSTMGEDGALRELKDLDDVKLWIAEHDGRIEERWEQQWRENRHTKDTLDRHDAALQSLEKRIAWFAGMAAALGSIGGTMISWILSR